jgi:hypothetical protein
MTGKHRGFLVCSLALFCAFFSFAQETGMRLLRSSGGELMLNAGDVRNLYTPQDLGPEGLDIRSGDMLQTGTGTFAEIGSGSLSITIAENTSIVFRGGVLEFVYGRMRLTGDSEKTAAAFMIHTTAADVLFEGGDVGVDYAYEPAGSGPAVPVLRVYGFSGGATIVSRGGGPAAPSFPLSEAEALSLRLIASHAYVERKALDGDIVDYWNSYGFDGPRLSLPGETEQAGEPVVEIRYAETDYTPYITRNRQKNVAAAAGTLFVLLGGGLSGFGHYAPERYTGGHGDTLQVAGYSSMGFGALMLLGSLFINPRYPQAAGESSPDPGAK